MAKLPIFDEANHCPKCGDDESAVKYCPGKKCFAKAGQPDVDEHLHRTCCRCGYLWFEAPMDAEGINIRDRGPKSPEMAVVLSEGILEGVSEAGKTERKTSESKTRATTRRTPVKNKRGSK